MNKKIIGISVVLLVLFAVGTMSVFAEDNQPKEYEYKVTVNYQKLKVAGGGFDTLTYTVWATSAREAESKALELCKYDVETKGKGQVSSCGAANATGRSRPAK